MSDRTRKIANECLIAIEDTGLSLDGGLIPVGNIIQDALDAESRYWIQRCADIAQKIWQQHTGFAGDYDGGAASASRKIKDEIAALLKETGDGK